MKSTTPPLASLAVTFILSLTPSAHSQQTATTNPLVAFLREYQPQFKETAFNPLPIRVRSPRLIPASVLLGG